MPKETFFNLPEEKRRHILAVAIDEFAQRGYRQAGVSRIVAAAGIAKGSFYQYFADKDDLYCHIVTTEIAERKLRVYEQEKKRLEDLSLTGFLRLVFRRQAREFTEHPQLFRIAMELAQLSDEPVYQQIMAPYAGRSQNYYIEFIQHEIDQGEIDAGINLRLLNYMILSVGHYLLGGLQSGEFTEISDELIDSLVDDLERILARGIYITPEQRGE